jgi:hypothetical protein
MAGGEGASKMASVFVRCGGLDTALWRSAAGVHPCGRPAGRVKIAQRFSAGFGPRKKGKSRQGRKKAGSRKDDLGSRRRGGGEGIAVIITASGRFCRPWRDLAGVGRRGPTVETVGNFRSSPTGLARLRRRKGRLSKPTRRLMTHHPPETVSCAPIRGRFIPLR